MLLLSIRLPDRIIGWSKGMVGLWALQRTLVPEMTRLVSEFEASMTTEVEVQGADHHEVHIQRSFQVSFFKDVKSLVTTIEDFGNHFLNESEDLTVLDTKEIAGPASVTILRQIEAVGKEQCNQFITERLLNRAKSLYDPIRRNKVSLFNFSQPKELCKTSEQLSIDEAFQGAIRMVGTLGSHV